MTESDKFQYRSGDFQKNTYDNYNLHWNISALLAPREPFSGFRKCIVSGFTAWMVDPGNSMTRKIAISEEISRIIARMEKKLVKENAYTSMMGTHLLIGQKFYFQIYLAIGGMSELSVQSRRNSFRKRTAKRRIYLSEAEALVTIMHHVQDHAGTRGIRSASLNSSAKVARAEFGTSSETQAIKNWQKVKSNISFAYAAKSIQREKGDLLTLLFGRRTSQIPPKEMLRLLMRARYTCDHILSHIPPRTTSAFERGITPFELNMNHIPSDIEPESFEHSPISEAQSRAILGAFGSSD